MRYFQIVGADVVQRFVVHADGHVAVFGELVNREHGVVWLHHSFRDEWTRHHRKGRQHPVRLFFAKFRQQQGAESGTGAASK